MQLISDRRFKRRALRILAELARKPIPRDSERKLRWGWRVAGELGHAAWTVSDQSRVDYWTCCEQVEENWVSYIKMARRDIDAAADILVDHMRRALSFYVRSWLVILPLSDASGWSREFRGILRLGDSRVLSPRGRMERFERTFNLLLTPEGKLQRHATEHQVTVSEQSLLTRPLLILRYEGTEFLLHYFFADRVRNLFSLLRLYNVLLREGTKEFEPIPMVLGGEGEVAHYFYLDLSVGQYLKRRPLGDRVSGLRLRLDSEMAKFASENGLDQIMDVLSEGALPGTAARSRDTILQRAKSALEFFAIGYSAQHQPMKLLSYVIALEALFSRDKNTPLRQTLADSVSLVLASGYRRRLAIYRDIIRLYDERSEVVHTALGRVDEKLAEKARSYAARAIHWAFTRGLQEDMSKDKLIEYVTRLKLS